MNTRRSTESEEPKSHSPQCIQLPDFGIPAWTLGEVEVAAGLNLYRENLGADAGFFREFGVNSLDEALTKFIKTKPFWTPLSYEFKFAFAAISYQVYVSAPLFRCTRFKVAPRQRVSIGAPWEKEWDNTIFELYVDRNYRRCLRVGGFSQVEAERHWLLTARFLRGRIRGLRCQI